MSSMQTLPNAFLAGSTGACGKAMLFNLLKSDPCPFNKLTVLSRRPLASAFPEIVDLPNYSKLEELVLPDFDVIVQAAENITGGQEPIFRRPITSAKDGKSSVAVDPSQEQKLLDMFSTADVGFSCFGTTTQATPKEAVYWRIDVEYPVAIANYWAKVRMANRDHKGHLLVVTSGGSNPGSWARYMRWKGQLEQALAKVPLDKLCILRPGMIFEGQYPRFSTGFAGAVTAKIFGVFNKLAPNAYQVDTCQIAQAMHKLAFGPLPENVDGSPLGQYKSNPPVAFAHATCFDNKDIIKLAESR